MVSNMNINTSVSLDEAPCLVASEDPLRMVFVCPHGCLVDSDYLGPHYSEQEKDVAVARLDALLALSREQDAELVMAPEYFCPQERISSILDKPQLYLRQGTLYALPIESISPEDYATLQNKCTQNAHCVTAGAISPGTSVNACAILFLSTSGGLTVVLQPKIYPSQPEEDRLARGDTLFVVKGSNIGFMVLICSDANKGTYHPYWADAAAKNGGPVYVAHLQFNRSPDYENYPVFRNAILSNQAGDRRLIFSLNWTKGSRLQRADGTTIEIPRSRTRLFRGKKYSSRPLSYRDISLGGIHNHHGQHPGGNGKYGWDIWHCLNYSDHAHLLQLARAWENRPAPEVRKSGVVTAKFFELDGDNYNECDALAPVDKVIDYCRSQDVPDEVLTHLSSWSLSELECFVNAVLLVTRGLWFTSDLCRIPTAPHVCVAGKSCVNDGAPCDTGCEQWQRAFEWVCDCLIKLHQHVSTTSGTDRAFPPTATDYPLNTEEAATGRQGLLIHSQARPQPYLEKSLAALLKDMPTIPSRLTIFCPSSGTRPREDNLRGLLGIDLGNPSVETDRITDPTPRYDIDVVTI